MEEFAKEIGCHKNALHQYRKKQTSPKLATAIKIYMLTKGQVSLLELLSENDQKEIENWLQEKNLTL